MEMNTPAESKPNRVLAITEKELLRSQIFATVLGGVFVGGFLSLGVVLGEGINYFGWPRPTPNPFSLDHFFFGIAVFVLSLGVSIYASRVALKPDNEEWKQAREIAALPGQEVTE